MEPFSDRNHGGVVEIDDSRVSGNLEGIQIESDERVFSNGVDNGGIDLRLNGEVSVLGFIDDEKIGENLVGSRLGRNLESKFNLDNEKIEVYEVGKLDGIDLVVDLNCYSLKRINQNEFDSNAPFNTNGDSFSIVDSFKPDKVIQCVQDLAKDPFSTSRFEVSTLTTQLFSFYRSKGYYQLCSNQVLDENKVSKNGKLNTCGSVSPKRSFDGGQKRSFDGGFGPSKKMRLLSELMSSSKTIKTCQKRKDFESNSFKEAIQSWDSDEFLLNICFAAINPIQEQLILNSLIKFSSDFRNYRLETNSNSQFTFIEDSYWTDRIIQINPDDEPFSSPKMIEENSKTALILKFTSLGSIPSVTNLNEIFTRYGPLRELETEVLKNKNCAKVVFLRRSDAETAFSSAGKFSIFGPALVSYCLDYSPTPRKTPKQNKKGGKSVKAKMEFEN